MLWLAIGIGLSLALDVGIRALLGYDRLYDGEPR